MQTLKAGLMYLKLIFSHLLHMLLKSKIHLLFGVDANAHIYNSVCMHTCLSSDFSAYVVSEKCKFMTLTRFKLD